MGVEGKFIPKSKLDKTENEIKKLSEHESKLKKIVEKDRKARV